MDPTQVQLIRDYEPALFFFGYPGEAGAERFFPSDAKRYIEHAALYLAKKPFATRSDWGAPIVEADQLRANEQEGGVFLGKRDGSGHPLYLETPPDQECFLANAVTTARLIDVTPGWRVVWILLRRNSIDRSVTWGS